MAQLPLIRRDGAVVAYALVDDDDLRRVADRRWYRDFYGYVVSWDASRQTTVSLHRLLLGLEPGDSREVDHVSGDRLDNRRENLRSCTHAENAQNMRPQVGCSSRFRGVGWDSWTGRWKAYATLGGERRYLGRFDSEEEAAAAVAQWRADHMPFSADALTARAA